MIPIEELVARVCGLVYEKTQRGPAGLELTLRGVRRQHGGGALDFGGSEYLAPEAPEVAPVKGPEDKYGWWQLEPGAYRLEFNESLSLSLSQGERALVTPHPRLLMAGGSHPSVIFGPDEEMFATLQVFQGGLRLKENCRVSRLAVLAP